MPVNHLEAHALTARLTDGCAFPYLLLLVSGGHTQIVLVEGVGSYSRWATTIDDALGEAFDKTAKLLCLPYPGGPNVERAARDGDPARFALPRPLIRTHGCDFSFSGLKTAVLYNVHGVPTKDSRPPSTPPQLEPQRLADIAASFQAACVAVIVKKLKRAIKKTGAKSVIVGGGVAYGAGKLIGFIIRMVGSHGFSEWHSALAARWDARLRDHRLAMVGAGIATLLLSIILKWLACFWSLCANMQINLTYQ